MRLLNVGMVRIALSAALSILIASLWLRSYWICDVFFWSSSSGAVLTTAVNSGRVLFSYNSCVEREKFNSPTPGINHFRGKRSSCGSSDEGELDLWVRLEDIFNRERSSREIYKNRVRLLGFCWQTAWRAAGYTANERAGAVRGPVDGEFLLIPFWFVQLLALVETLRAGNRWWTIRTLQR